MSFIKDAVFFAYSGKASLLTVGAFLLAYSGKVRLIRALRDCKPRSLTVNKKTPTVSKKTSPLEFKRGVGWPS